MVNSGRLTLRQEDLQDFVRGAAFLGTGGGGDPYVGRLILQQEMAKGAEVRILPLADLADDALVVPVAMMGAPTVMTEKVPSIEALQRALDEVARGAGRKVDALIPLEIGGINSTMPLVVGARGRLPVVNADGMGRAFPEIQMVTFGVYGCPISPVVVANELGDVVTVRAVNNKQGEDLARSVVVRMGGAAHIALYPMTGADVKATAIPDTLTLALDIGRIIRTARAERKRPEVALCDHVSRLPVPRTVKVLFDGKIVDVRRETKGGFNVGSVSLDGIADWQGVFKVEFQNENLIAYHDGAVRAMVPDLITLVDRETGEPITTECLKYGQRVKVIGLSVPPIMRTPEALATFGPRAFRLDHDYVPLEEIR
ncbi:MAG: DUF917 domain-containing protein [Alphaproteobacteria bacterium]|nr:MAG: DUF917 domain-containing protein [Alphaproteobacteria bacterium]